MRTAYVLLSQLTDGDTVRLGRHSIHVRGIVTRDGHVVIKGTTTRGDDYYLPPIPDRPVQVWRDRQR